ADSDCEKDAACVGTNKPPIITSFTCTLLGGTTIGFAVTVEDPDDTEFYYLFDWGDGKSSSKTDGPTTTTSYIFADNQTQSFTVTVTVNDASGSDVATVMVNCLKKAGCSCN
ncbi:PKD domain-containing protein, partial [Candidatus Calescamantes bacterium]|nr:PKD domain-containing protein [Candidatus Calescamantes bacterium]